MIQKISMTARVTFSLVWMALALFMYANAFGQWWLMAAGCIVPVMVLCMGHTVRLMTFLLDFLAALVTEPDKERESRMEEEITITRAEVEEIAKNLHNMGSRNVCAIAGVGSLLAVWIAPEPLEFAVGCAGAVVIALAAYWPFVARILREQAAQKAQA